MEHELRPQSLGEILDRTFQIYRAHFLMFAGISTLAAAVDLIWKLIQQGTIHVLAIHASVPALGFANSGFSILAFLVYVVASAVAMAAINRAVSAVYLGQPIGIALAYNEIKPHWFRYVRLYVVAFFLAWGAAVVVIVGISVATIFLATSGALGPTLILGVLALSLLLILPFGAWMMLRYSLANAACVFEDIGVRAALKRSIFLTQEMRGKIFVMFLLAGVLIMVLTYPVLIPLMWTSIRSHSQMSFVSTVITLVVSFIVTSLTTPFYGIALTLFYYDSRIRKEGFDIDWLMQRANLANPPAELPPAPSAAPSLG